MLSSLTSSAIDRSEPATINVGSSPTSYTTVPFNTYVQDVLPNEWPSGYSWPQEAYKAGAIAVKMHGWYRIDHPVNAPLNVYDDTRSQVYVAGSGQSTSAQQTTTPAIAAVRSKGMETSGGQLFLPQYWNGRCKVNNSGGAYLYSSYSASSTRVLIANGTPVWAIDNGEHFADGTYWCQIAVGGVYPSTTTNVGYMVPNVLLGLDIGANTVASMRGRATQYGTVYWANQNWDYQQILSYFYPNIHFFTVSTNAGADLTVIGSVIFSPSTVAPGGTVHVEWTEKNQGTASAPVHYVKVSLATTAYGRDYQLAYGSVSGLSAGQTQAYYVDAAVPTSVPAGSYYVTVFVDSDLEVAETDENNNIGSSSPNKVTVSTTQTRVIGLSGSLTFGSVLVGSSAQRTMTISNTGNSTLTVNGISYPSGFSGSFSGTIPAGGSQDVTVTFAPGAPGSYGGTATVASNATSGTNTIAASGTGTSNPNPPTVQTLPASSVTSSSAVINGMVMNTGGAPVDHYYFYYWIDPASKIGIDDTRITVSGNSFSAQIFGLSPGTPYHYRAYAHNSSLGDLGAGPGWGFGSVVSFGTAPFTKPDFNGDNQADILWQNNITGERTIWLISGGNATGSVSLPTIATEWQIASTGDFNGDGQVDILWRNLSTGEVRIWLMNGTQNTGPVILPTIALEWQIAGTGDFNGDGQIDILWQNSRSGERRIWLMNGTQSTGPAILPTIATEWEIAGTGDFNGDGQVDILWRSVATGEVRIWLMNGTQSTGAAILPTIATQWQIAGTGDFNGDGHVDILWQDKTTGERRIWLMNRTQPNGTAILPTIAKEWEMRNH
jgi:hypothetical protein